MRAEPKICYRNCCFMGHRDAPDWLYPVLRKEVERHILQYGVNRFFVGNYGGFDRMAAFVLGTMKAQYPHIRFYQMIAYPPEQEWRELPPGCERAVYPKKLGRVPEKAAIPVLNRTVVDASSYAIAYICRISSGAYQTWKHARLREQKGLLHLTNLAGLEAPRCSGLEP